ncbi:MAG: hypothetical protein ACRCTJ_03765 [Brevinema sp.]
MNLTNNRKIVAGRIGSGDVFVNHYTTRAHLAEYIGAIAIDMESGALAQVSYRYQLPILVVRTINNTFGKKAGDHNNKYDYVEHLEKSANNSAQFIMDLVQSEQFPY